MKEKQIIDSESFYRTLKRMSHQILENRNNYENIKDLVLVGIKRRGYPLALILADNIKEISGIEVSVLALDITFYRDDLSKEYPNPHLNEKPGIDLTGKNVIIVDDVIYTGRTSRAALDAIMDLGRPDIIQLVEFVDRGHRELPIRPDYVGKNVPTSKEEKIEVRLPEFDGEAGVYLISNSN